MMKKNNQGKDNRGRAGKRNPTSNSRVDSNSDKKDPKKVEQHIHSNAQGPTGGKLQLFSELIKPFRRLINSAGALWFIVIPTIMLIMFFLGVLTGDWEPLERFIKIIVAVRG